MGFLRIITTVLTFSILSFLSTNAVDTVPEPELPEDDENSTKFFFEGHVPDEEIYRELDNAYFEDDMIFSKSDDTRMATSTAAKWPDGTVPYIISPNVTASLTQVIAEAVAYINKYTCVKFRRWKSTDQYWVRFVKDPSPSLTKLCSAYTGFQSKKDQGIFLGPRCTFGSMVHELLHALGFNHEHTRNDRNQYILVNTKNYADASVGENYALDSEKCTSGRCTYNDYQVNYNYESIMHYCPKCACREPNCPVFTVIPNGKIPGRKAPLGSTTKIGQREAFSRGDWLMVNRRYGCNIQQQEDPPELSAYPEIQQPEFGEDAEDEDGSCPTNMEGNPAPTPAPGTIEGGIDEEDGSVPVPNPGPVQGGTDEDDFIEDDK